LMREMSWLRVRDGERAGGAGGWSYG
jgi:hypothetical protein